MRRLLAVTTVVIALTAGGIFDAKAGEMEMGQTKVTIGGQLRERLEWWGKDIHGNGSQIAGSYRARLNIKAELADGVTAVFTPQAVGYWGEGGQGLGLGEDTSFTMHEAYLLLSEPFGIKNTIVKVGRQEINLGNQRLVGAVGWSQAGRSLDGILVGYVAGDYGLAGFFYGKLNDEMERFDAWAVPANPEPDIDLYVATWQGKFKPFGFGGTYELTDIYVNPATNALGADANVNTLYGRVTPKLDMGFGKITLNGEVAVQSGDFGSADFEGYMFSVGAGAKFDQIMWKPSVYVGYDYYSGDDDPNDGDLDAFWSVLPTAHKWLGHADVVWANTPFYQFNGTGLENVANQSVNGFNVAGVKDLYLKTSVTPTDRIKVGLDIHYFKSAEDVVRLSDNKNFGNDIGWEADLEGTYKYSKNLTFSLGYNYFNPDDAMEAVTGSDDSVHHVWAQVNILF